MNTQRHEPARLRARTLVAFLGLATFLGLSLALTSQAQDKDKKADPDKAVKPAVEPDKAVKPAVDPAVKPKAPKDPDKDVMRPLQKIRVKGYTLPGNIPDIVEKGGDIKPVGLVHREKIRIVGGTVYFVVLERSEAERDTWGTGTENFDESFVPGKSFAGTHSPNLDTDARFIYLYQVVNDRGLRPDPKAKPKGEIGLVFDEEAIDNKRPTPTENIASFALRLRVDPRYVTSWGHFQAQGLIHTVEAAKVPEGVRQVAFGLGELAKKFDVATSGASAMMTPLPAGQLYKPRSPRHKLEDLWGNSKLEIGSATYNLKDNPHVTPLLNRLAKASKGGSKIAQVANDNIEAATVRANEPDYVQVIVVDDADPANVAGAVPPPNLDLDTDNVDNAEYARVIFRADWRAPDRQIKFTQHSVIFGFTSDLPPRDEPGRVDDLPASQVERGIRQFPEAPMAAALDKLMAASAEIRQMALFAISLPNPAASALIGQVADSPLNGTAPAGVKGLVAPDGRAAPAGGGAMLPGGGFGSLGGTPSGGGAGGAPTPAGGAIGAARPGLGGGGIGGGNGGGNGGGTGSGNGNPTTTTTTTPAGNTVNFNATLTNQQSQAQFQSQFQLQSQTSNNCCCPPTANNVVPAPASLLLALLGLPGLYIMRRRKQNAALAAEAASSVS